MQLHVSGLGLGLGLLLLFIYTTGKKLATSRHSCGGSIDLQWIKNGFIKFTQPGLVVEDNSITYNDSNTGKPLELDTVCTWVIDVPGNGTVQLEGVSVDGGSEIMVLCGASGEQRGLVAGEMALLLGCGTAVVTWRALRPRTSQHNIQLFYTGQEAIWNSSERQGPWMDVSSVQRSETPRNKTMLTLGGRRGEGGEMGDRGDGGSLHPSESFVGDLELDWIPGSTPTLQGLSPTSSPQAGLTVAGHADTEVPLLPEEEPDNRRDMSGTLQPADHVTTGPLAGPGKPGRTLTPQRYTLAGLTERGRAPRWRSTRSIRVWRAERGPGMTPDPEGLKVTSEVTLSQTEWGLTSVPVTGVTEGLPGPDITSQTPASSSPDPDRSNRRQTTRTEINSGTDSSFSLDADITNGTEPDRDKGYNWTTNPFISSPFTTDELPLADVVQTTASPLTSDRPLLVTTSTSTMMYSESQWPETDPDKDTDTPLLSHTHNTHTHKPEHTHDTHTPLSQTHVLSSTSVSPIHTPLQEHTNTNGPVALSTHPDHSVLTATATTLTSPSGPTTTTLTASRRPTATTLTASRRPTATTLTASRRPTTTTLTSPSGPTTTTLTSPSGPTTTTLTAPSGPTTTTTQPSSTTRLSPSLRTTRSQPSSTPHPSQGSPSAAASSGVSPSPPHSTISSTHRPRVYIVPDWPAAIKEETIELLLQMIVQESSSDLTTSLEEDSTAWVAPYLQRAPGFQDLQGVWSSGGAVQSAVVFRTSGALAWLGVSGPDSLLERTGLAQAVREGRSFSGSKVMNITVGGVQEDVCLWLFQCTAGFECVSRPGHMAVCSSVCHSDYCHNHGICTHHPHQPPLCQCPVGDHFWFMGRRCDVRMTQQRLVGVCLGVLVAIVTLIGIVAWLAVRRYRAMLIKAKVDQTRSSYRRFNHFDELSGRFWGRSIGGSADSLDNPAFTRSDELLHLRALDRTCCYHDDTMSLSSTCPSNGTHLNTVYPHNSQYGWAVSEVSLAECVVDSGKASDLSVCSWPIEPIQWTPFPLLQQLSSTHRTTPVRVPRPRSYCEGMELVELEKSWTA